MPGYAIRLTSDTHPCYTRPCTMGALPRSYLKSSRHQGTMPHKQQQQHTQSFLGSVARFREGGDRTYAAKRTADKREVAPYSFCTTPADEMKPLTDVDIGGQWSWNSIKPNARDGALTLSRYPDRKIHLSCTKQLFRSGKTQYLTRFQGDVTHGMFSDTMVVDHVVTSVVSGDTFDVEALKKELRRIADLLMAFIQKNPRGTAFARASGAVTAVSRDLGSVPRAAAASVARKATAKSVGLFAALKGLVGAAAVAS